MYLLSATFGRERAFLDTRARVSIDDGDVREHKSYIFLRDEAIAVKVVPKK